MARGRRRLAEGASIWPGFVDVLSGLLMIIIFLVLVLSVAQFFLSSDFDLISDRAQALERDNATLNAENQGLQGQVDQLSGQIELLFEQIGERTAERDQIDCACFHCLDCGSTVVTVVAHMGAVEECVES